MTSTSAPADARDVRRATRDSQAPIIGGVAGGLARHLAVPVMWVRAGSCSPRSSAASASRCTPACGWCCPPTPTSRTRLPASPAPPAAADGPSRIRRLTDVGPAIALAALAFGAILLLEAVLGQGAVFWPVFIGLVGIALLWRQADEAQRERWLDTTGRVDPVRAVLGSGGWAAYARLAAGVGLIITALVLFSFRGGSVGMARDITVAALLTVVGLAIVVGPWVFRLASDLTAERAERVRTQERADLAAHLHDSVLQTLALIQKNANDGPTVARLARSQERDLRSWLYVGESTDDRSVASALRGVAAEVEDAHGVSVEVVTVGDCPMSEALRPVVNATREAVTNAAKHAGTGQVDVYAEITDAAVDVFVRDRGQRLRPGHHRRGPVRRPQQHHRPDGPARRLRRRTLHTRRGHRGAAAPSDDSRRTTDG